VAADGDRPSILVIDDDAVIRGILVAYLAKKGFDVIAVPSYEIALRNYSAENFAAVFCDIIIEDGMGGVEGIQELRRVSPSAMIIAISGGFLGMLPGVALRMAEAAGADRALKKPIDFNELAGLLSDLANPSD